MPRCGLTGRKHSTGPHGNERNLCAAADTGVLAGPDRALTGRTASASMRLQGLDGNSPCLPVKAAYNCVLPGMRVHDSVI